MKRFRVYDKSIKEVLEQDEDYSFRDSENYYMVDLTDAFTNPHLYVVQENTGIKDILQKDIFEGDKVSFNEDICGQAIHRIGVVTRSDTGMWMVMVDETIPFGLYHVKHRMVFGHINEGDLA